MLILIFDASTRLDWQREG